MKKFLYLVYPLSYSDIVETANKSFIVGTEDEAWEKMAEMNSIIGVPPYVIKKVQIRSN